MRVTGAPRSSGRLRPQCVAWLGCVCVCAAVWLCVLLCGCVCGCVCLCVCWCVCVCVCLCVAVCVCVWLCVAVCVAVCAAVCSCVYVCVSWWLGSHASIFSACVIGVRGCDCLQSPARRDYARAWLRVTAGRRLHSPAAETCCAVPIRQSADTAKVRGVLPPVTNLLFVCRAAPGGLPLPSHWTRCWRGTLSLLVCHGRVSLCLCCREETSGAGGVYLFEGPPGTGKTTTARIIAKHIDLPMVRGA